MDSHLCPHRTHIRAVNQPFKAIGSGDLHLVVNTLKNQMGTYAAEGSVLWLYQIDVFRPDDYVHRPVVAKAFVHTGKSGSEDFHQLVPDHNARNDVALADKIGHECIFRLIVNLLRRPRLLDIALIQKYNRE